MKILEYAKSWPQDTQWSCTDLTPDFCAWAARHMRLQTRLTLGMQLKTSPSEPSHGSERSEGPVAKEKVEMPQPQHGLSGTSTDSLHWDLSDSNEEMRHGSVKHTSCTSTAFWKDHFGVLLADRTRSRHIWCSSLFMPASKLLYRRGMGNFCCRSFKAQEEGFKPQAN